MTITKRGEAELATKKRMETRSAPAPKKAKGSEGEARRTVRRPAAKTGPAAGRPRLRTHAAVPDGSAAPRRRSEAAGASIAAAVKAGRGASPGPAVRKAPLAAPKRPAKPRVAPEGAEVRLEVRPAPSNASRDLSLSLASAGLDMKAIGIEILDVTGKVDYADFLVVMTGRSDRHVYAIAMGLEEGVRKLKISPLSVEGLTASTWVLIDFGDVVVHVFQEEARSLYDIEGLWINAGRVPVPAEEGPPPAGSGDLG